MKSVTRRGIKRNGQQQHAKGTSTKRCKETITGKDEKKLVHKFESTRG